MEIVQTGWVERAQGSTGRIYHDLYITKPLLFPEQHQIHIHTRCGQIRQHVRLAVEHTHTHT